MTRTPTLDNDLRRQAAMAIVSKPQHWGGPDSLAVTVARRELARLGAGEDSDQHEPPAGDTGPQQLPLYNDLSNPKVAA